MISDLRRVNNLDNPFELWEVLIDGEPYWYNTNPVDASSYRDSPLKASSELVRSREDEDASYVIITRWSLEDIHLTMNSNNYKEIVLHILLVGEKSVERQLNGCI